MILLAIRALAKRLVQALREPSDAQRSLAALDRIEAHLDASAAVAETLRRTNRELLARIRELEASRSAVTDDATTAAKVEALRHHDFTAHAAPVAAARLCQWGTAEARKALFEGLGARARDALPCARTSRATRFFGDNLKHPCDVCDEHNAEGARIGYWSQDQDQLASVPGEPTPHGAAPAEPSEIVTLPSSPHITYNRATRMIRCGRCPLEEKVEGGFANEAEQHIMGFARAHTPCPEVSTPASREAAQRRAYTQGFNSVFGIRE